MLPNLMIHDWARRLIASEVDADLPSARTERVYEKLRRQLCAPVGNDGFQALASRALSLAKSQSTRLSDVQVLANGGLSGLKTDERELATNEDGEVGVILIAQLLGLFLTLLGEAATVRLIGDVPLRIEVEAQLDSAAKSTAAPDTNFFGPFEGILSEADQLRNVSERLETLADTHVGIGEIMGVAGSIRGIAAVLDVFTVIRSKTGGSLESLLNPARNDYLN